MVGKAFGHRNQNLPKGDLHQTPYSMTEQLLQVEYFGKKILEPAAGEGAIKRVLLEKMHSVEYFDKFYGDKHGDFLEYKKHVDYIITNPPYGKLADDFVLHAKKICNIKFAFLLRTNYLSGQTRLRKGVYENLKTVYVFSRMADLKAPIREDGKYPTAMIVYAWFIWNMNYLGEPKIKFIDNSMYCMRTADR